MACENDVYLLGCSECVNDPQMTQKKTAKDALFLAGLVYKLYGKTLERMSDNLKDSFDSVKLSFGFPFAFVFESSQSVARSNRTNETKFCYISSIV